jgi:hypothetical protein
LCGECNAGGAHGFEPTSRAPVVSQTPAKGWRAALTGQPTRVRKISWWERAVAGGARARVGAVQAGPGARRRRSVPMSCASTLHAPGAVGAQPTLTSLTSRSSTSSAPRLLIRSRAWVVRDGLRTDLSRWHALMIPWSAQAHPHEHSCTSTGVEPFAVLTSLQILMHTRTAEAERHAHKLHAECECCRRTWGLGHSLRQLLASTALRRD